ncbi:alpha/beta fold hydrolase, partial [Vibrio sp. D173a]|uniref:alpha/beta fold hydrolase n=1 Tax=Vibrio sp. D173a TaxID=2836349 RepID=UPI00255522AF
RASALVVGLGFSLAIPGLSVAATSQVPVSVEAQNTELSQAAKEWQATGNYLTIEGHNIFYHDVGEGPVIVLLHGHPSSSLDWRETVDILKDKARVITFDHVGWGLSDKPVAFSYSLMEMADITEEILNELDVESAHVVSHDISTSVHSELMARHLEGSLSFYLESSMLTNGSIIQWISDEPPEQKLAESNETLFEAIKAFRKASPVIPDILTSMTIGNLSEERI